MSADDTNSTDSTGEADDSAPQGETHMLWLEYSDLSAHPQAKVLRLHGGVEVYYDLDGQLLGVHLPEGFRTIVTPQ